MMSFLDMVLGQGLPAARAMMAENSYQHTKDELAFCLSLGVYCIGAFSIWVMMGFLYNLRAHRLVPRRFRAYDASYITININIVEYSWLNLFILDYIFVSGRQIMGGMPIWRV